MSANYTAADLEEARAKADALRDEGSAAARQVKEMEARGQFGRQLAEAKAKRDQLSSQYFLAAKEATHIGDAIEAVRERGEATAKKATKVAQIAAWNRPYIEAVRQAGEQVDDAILNLAESIMDLVQAQEPAADICMDTAAAFDRANQRLLPVINRKLAQLISTRDNRVLSDAILATFTQHLPAVQEETTHG